MPDICERCGLDLDTLGMWKEFVHCVPGSRNKGLVGNWCLPPQPLAPEEEKAIDDFAQKLAERFRGTLENILNGQED